MRILKRGFTVVEVLIIVAVIGILSTVGVVSLNRYRADARDAQKSSQISVIAEALEKYFENNGEYPSCSSLTQDPNTIASNVLPGIDPTNFVVPSSGLTNSMLCGAISDTKNFGYVGDGSGACSGSVACASYQLQYKKESTGEIVTLSSQNSADILTASSVSINAAGAADCTNGFNGLNLTWNHVSGASSYTVQRDTASTFLATNPNFVESTSSTNSTLVGGLNPDTSYFVRVRAMSNDGRYGYWSNAVNRTTLNPAISLSGTAGSFSATLNWTANSCASQYMMQRATDSGFSQNLVSNTYSSSVLTDTYSGLTGGTTYYFRTKIITSGGYNGPWTSTVNVVPLSAPPAAPEMAYVTTGTFEVSNTVSGAVYTATLVSGSGTATQSVVNGKVRFALSSTTARFSVTASWTVGGTASAADYMERKPHANSCYTPSWQCNCNCYSTGNCWCVAPGPSGCPAGTTPNGQCGCGGGSPCMAGSIGETICNCSTCYGSQVCNLIDAPGYTNSGSEWYKVS